ncbi:pectinesterase inhibitor 10-like [Zingiber officinale]|uniref:pectinesterase inhibitor 10-like n=1 Tax=Zingiber officinale TaxID=94328 RepID=UPI001C4D926C|nr:pectinesterase inhibitor 10-like [Zingiber officinale]
MARALASTRRRAPLPRASPRDAPLLLPGPFSPQTLRRSPLFPCPKPDAASPFSLGSSRATAASFLLTSSPSPGLFSPSRHRFSAASSHSRQVLAPEPAFPPCTSTPQPAISFPSSHHADDLSLVGFDSDLKRTLRCEDIPARSTYKGNR